MVVVSFICSILGLVSIMLSLLMKGKDMKRILMLSLLGNGLMVASYGCVLNWSGAASSALGTAASVINFLYAVKNSPLPKVWPVVYAALFVSVNLLTFASWVDLLAICACLIFVLLVCSPEGKKYRIWSLVNNSIWVLFDILKGSYGPLVTHIALTSVTAVGMVIHDRKQKINQ